MSNPSKGRRVLLAALAAVVAFAPVAAEDVEKKFRVGLSMGFFNAQDVVPSDAANALALFDDDLIFVSLFRDPRNDSAIFGNLEIQPGALATISGQYALTKIFLVEASVGYQKTDVGDVEVQAQFDGVTVPDIQNFAFEAYRIQVGELERVPIQLSALVRFRPRASFNPYLGGGVGYTLIGFEPVDEFDELSRNLDQSRGGQGRVTEDTFGTASLSSPSADEIGDLSGARIDARDTWEWHLAGGAELSFKRSWAFYLDFRYTVASRSFEVGFNGGQDLGIAVPNLVDFVSSAVGSQTFGPVRIVDGGLIDGGSFVPEPGAPANTDCSVSTTNCEFDVTVPDGVLDTGYYYVQGGSIDYGGFSGQVGVRFTF